MIVQLRAVFCPSVQYLTFLREAFSWAILLVTFPYFTVVKSFSSWYALLLLFFLRFSSVSLLVSYPVFCCLFHAPVHRSLVLCKVFLSSPFSDSHLIGHHHMKKCFTLNLPPFRTTVLQATATLDKCSTQNQPTSQTSTLQITTTWANAILRRQTSYRPQQPGQVFCFKPAPFLDNRPTGDNDMDKCSALNLPLS